MSLTVRSATTVMVGLLRVAHIIDPDADALREREDAWQIFGAGERRKEEANNDQEADKAQTEVLLNEFCVRLSDVRKESREQRADEGGSGRNNPLAHRPF